MPQQTQDQEDRDAQARAYAQDTRQVVSPIATLRKKDVSKLLADAYRAGWIAARRRPITFLEGENDQQFSNQD